MDIKRCPNGHFYDSEKYMECPHCDSSADSPIFKTHQGKKDKVVKKEPQSESNRSEKLKKRERTYSGERTVSYQEEAQLSKLKKDDNKTQSFQDADFIDERMKEERRGAKENYDEDKEKIDKDNSLSELLKRTRAYDNKEVKTVGVYENQNNTEPVVGWLVCVEGSAYGYPYTLKTGKNHIGRGADMDIVITGDNSVSRENHTVLMFEPRGKEFILLSVESKGLVYVNEKSVDANTKLRAKDIITLGQTKLLFIPLCDEEFDWSHPTEITRRKTPQSMGYPQTAVADNRGQEPETSVLIASRADMSAMGGTIPGGVWTCPICATNNPVVNEYCHMCGASKTKCKLV